MVSPKAFPHSPKKALEKSPKKGLRSFRRTSVPENLSLFRVPDELVPRSSGAADGGTGRERPVPPSRKLLSSKAERATNLGARPKDAAFAARRRPSRGKKYAAEGVSLNAVFPDAPSRFSSPLLGKMPSSARAASLFPGPSSPYLRQSLRRPSSYLSKINGFRASPPVLLSS